MPQIVREYGEHIKKIRCYRREDLSVLRLLHFKAGLVQTDAQQCMYLMLLG